MRPVGLGPEHNYVHKPLLKLSRYPQHEKPRRKNPWLPPPTPASKYFQNLRRGPGVMPLDSNFHRGLPASLQSLSLSSQSASRRLPPLSEGALRGAHHAGPSCSLSLSGASLKSAKNLYLKSVHSIFPSLFLTFRIQALSSRPSQYSHVWTSTPPPMPIPPPLYANLLPSAIAIAITPSGDCGPLHLYAVECDMVARFLAEEAS